MKNLAFQTLNTKLFLNQVDMEELIENTQVVLASYQVGVNKKELQVNPCISALRVQFSFGGQEQIEFFDDIDTAQDFYNKLTF